MLYQDFTKEYNKVWSYITKKGVDGSGEVNPLRGYTEALVGGIYTLEDWEPLRECSPGLGLFSKRGNPLLQGRYLIPVRDFQGNVVTLIGWYPDTKKYITCPSRYFKRDLLYFGMELIPNTLGGGIVLVEGIFDALRLRSAGVPTLAMQGVQSSPWKKAILSGYKRVLAIPDRDRAGREVVSRDKWGISGRGTYITWSGMSGIKDIDDLLTRAGVAGVLEELHHIATNASGRLVYTIELS